MMCEDTKEIQLRLKAPIIALEKVANGRYLPEVFAKAALNELRVIQRLTKKLRAKGSKLKVGA